LNRHRLNSSIDNLSERLDRLSPYTSIISSNNNSTNNNNNNNLKLTHWKGKKIIPLDKWLNITKANTLSRIEDYNVKEGLQYFPNDYTENLFCVGTEDSLENEANEWYRGYIELMEYTKNPRYGKTKCSDCLLSASWEKVGLYIGIHSVVIKGLAALMGGGSNGQEDNDAPITYPCRVLNRYECPFDNQKNIKEEDKKSELDDVDCLFALERMARRVEQAFGHAMTISKSNEAMYEVDFEANKIKEYQPTYYDGPCLCTGEYRLEEGLAKVEKLAAFPIRNEEDVYNALTSREMLDKVLEQGLDEEYRKFKDSLVEFFMTIKDSVRIEDLNVRPPVFKSNCLKGKCCICSEFANIRCTNCINVWLCTDHIEQHKIHHHTFC